MEITSKQADGAVVVSAVGSIDATTAPSFADHVNELITSGDVRMVVDLAGVDYTSSAGLRVLLGAAKETRAAGGDVRLAGVQPAVEKVLALSGFTSILKVFDDTSAALASFAS